LSGIGIEYEEALFDGFSQLTKAGFAFLEGHFDLFALGDIEHGAA
jgi:hypothetical protein